jgi:hypothetical protein
VVATAFFDKSPQKKSVGAKSANEVKQLGHLNKYIEVGTKHLEILFQIIFDPMNQKLWSIMEFSSVTLYVLTLPYKSATVSAASQMAVA